MKMDPKEREERAMAFFRQGYNCCQSVILAFEDMAAEKAGLTRAQLEAMGSGFGGGVARMREVCGCVSGLTMLGGIVCPARPAPHTEMLDHNSSEAMETRKANYALVQNLANAFKEENGSIICRELLGLRAGTAESPRPSDRTRQYYKARPCEQLVGYAAYLFASSL